MQLRIWWQAETWYGVKFCWSQWKLVELSIKGMFHSPWIHMSCGKSLRLLACTVFFSFGSFPSFKHTHFLSPMCLQFPLYSEFLLLLNSEYLISSYSSTNQLPLQVATVFFPSFFTSSHWLFIPRVFINAAFLQLSLASPFSFLLLHFSFHSVYHSVLRREIGSYFMPKNKGMETKGFTEVDRIIYCWKNLSDLLKLIEIPSVLEV